MIRGIYMCLFIVIGLEIEAPAAELRFQAEEADGRRSGAVLGIGGVAGEGVLDLAAEEDDGVAFLPGVDGVVHVEGRGFEPADLAAVAVAGEDAEARGAVAEEGHITRAAERWEADLIVMAARKRGRWGRLFWRGTAERVIEGVKCPVLTLQAQSKKEAYV